jgi:hypothetical protein
MTPFPIREPLATDSAGAPARVVVVVPRREARLHEYLRQSLAAVKDVDVVLDRRAIAVTPPADRRRRPSKDSERKLLICSIVRCPEDPPQAHTARAAPPPRVEGKPLRTLLWPGLRLEHL